MHRNRIVHLIAVFLLMLTSCIKRYDPEIKSTDAVKYVVTGQVIRGDQVQVVNIAKSSPFEKPEILPVSGCTVNIIDAKGNSYPAADVWNGNYEAIIPESELVLGSSFKVDIILPGGVHIVSDFDQIEDGPEVDSVYYMIQNLPTDSPVEFTEGIQFYLDIDGENYPCRYYKWEVVETYEYHTLYPVEWYYNGRVRHVFPPDSSKMVCWRTSKLRDVYMLSTKDLSQNKYKQFPLHFVDNYSSERLVYGYSLLVRQYSLSQAAYDYWEMIRVNSQDQGGLYERQPYSIKGNLHNITNPEHDVLGFFGATSVKQKRIFVQNVPDLKLEFVFNCVIDELPWGGLAGTLPINYPIYLPAHTFIYEDTIIYKYDLLSIDHECVDCTSTVGGTNIKPDFWPY